MPGVHVIGYQQKAEEGARDKAEHEADSLRAIRTHLTGELSHGGRGGRVQKGELYSFGHLALLSLETEIIEN